MTFTFMWEEFLSNILSIVLWACFWNYILKFIKFMTNHAKQTHPEVESTQEQTVSDAAGARGPGSKPPPNPKLRGSR